ncbi:MAG: NAD(P)H-hydrate dehydratase [Candidatus Omnitrophica bacterium]|nr:NAD(P)H-hydrate dehydratase [Candidatus Omnitrophota bacterium]
MAEQYLAKIRHERSRDSHKGDFGHVLVIAGSKGLTGAAYLTSQAAILSGSGLVTLALPESIYPVLAVKLTEVMTLPLPETKQGSLAGKAEAAIMGFLNKVDVVAIGPGLSREPETQRLVRKLLSRIKQPVVLDADGINALDDNAGALKKRKGVTVITPHPGEMARLTGKDVAYVQKNRESIAKSVSLQYNCVSVLKGHRTVVADSSGKLYVNDTGNSGMSSAGMGDVLTGVIASLIGQGIDAFSASIISVYLHGKAGDIVAAERGQFGLIATDVLNKLPFVFKEAV